MEREDAAQGSTDDADDFVDRGGPEDGDDDLDVAAAEEPPELNEQGRRILAFEARWWRRPGAKEQAVRDTFELTPTKYYQLLNALLDDPLALAHDPVLVQRLRRLRESRKRAH